MRVRSQGAICVFFGVVFLSLFQVSCKETEDRTIENNTALGPHRISTIKIEGYVNRLFIDLVGRSPLETELARETNFLKDAQLSVTAREELIVKLQSDTTEVIGDSSYAIAYNQRLYDIMKSRMLEGAEDGEFSALASNARFTLNKARLNGDSIGVYKAMEKIERNMAVINGKRELRKGNITINQLFARMMDNEIYDEINMNTFNFVNASFDDLFFRFPSQNEFDIAYAIIANNEPGGLFGGFASTKKGYCQLLTESDEFYEGLIQWTYNTLLARSATTQEVVNHFENLVLTGDFKQLQKEILRTDEYADF
ncbi:MAG: hypothetical protein JJ975_14040 [Bacteroidia bacterium]|nr:hypothetical protein [Bacteroidia bacterium]